MAGTVPRTSRFVVEGSGPSLSIVSMSLCHRPWRRLPSGAGMRPHRQLGFSVLPLHALSCSAQGDVSALSTWSETDD